MEDPRSGREREVAGTFDNGAAKQCIDGEAVGESYEASRAIAEQPGYTFSLSIEDIPEVCVQASSLLRGQKEEKSLRFIFPNCPINEDELRNILEFFGKFYALKEEIAKTPFLKQPLDLTLSLAYREHIQQNISNIFSILQFADYIGFDLVIDKVVDCLASSDLFNQGKDFFESLRLFQLPYEIQYKLLQAFPPDSSSGRSLFTKSTIRDLKNILAVKRYILLAVNLLCWDDTMSRTKKKEYKQYTP